MCAGSAYKLRLGDSLRHWPLATDTDTDPMPEAEVEAAAVVETVTEAEAHGVGGCGNAYKCINCRSSGTCDMHRFENQHFTGYIMSKFTNAVRQIKERRARLILK